MTKFIKTLIITICIIFSTTSFPHAEDNTCYISAQAAPSYTLIMPTTISLPFTNPENTECCIDFADIALEEGYGLEVTMEHDNFIHTSNSSYQFSYTTDFSKTIITPQNTEVCFKVYIDKFSLALAPSGKYTSKVTVTVRYVKL